jgi:hypothetical protein
VGAPVAAQESDVEAVRVSAVPSAVPR